MHLHSLAWRMSSHNVSCTCSQQGNRRPSNSWQPSCFVWRQQTRSWFSCSGSCPGMGDYFSWHFTQFFERAELKLHIITLCSYTKYPVFSFRYMWRYIIVVPQNRLFLGRHNYWWYWNAPLFSLTPTQHFVSYLFQLLLSFTFKYSLLLAWTEEAWNGKFIWHFYTWLAVETKTQSLAIGSWVFCPDHWAVCSYVCMVQLVYPAACD